MTINIMSQYIDLTKKQINSYMRLVFGNKFNKEYNNAYTEKYINIRYNNFYGNETGNIRKKIIDELKKEQENLVINNINDRDLIEQMCIFYYYILYFDDVVHCKDINQKIDKIGKLRARMLNKKDDNFVQDLKESINETKAKKEELIEKFNFDDFYLKISNYPNKINVYRVNLKYNIKFPPTFSEFAIEKAFNTRITNEDKLVIEYYLVIIQVLKDIIKQNFRRQYILEFAHTLLEKPKKIKGILNILDNVGIQDKVSLKIKYEYYLKYKEKIYELMREGYRFTLIIDNSFKPTYRSIEILKMFKYVILNKELKTYPDIIQYKEEIQNIIEI